MDNLKQQLSLFSAERLPHRPYCTDDYERGTWARQVSSALQKRYIQPNPPAVRFRLLFDVDRPAGALVWEDANLAPPNWAATNPRNGHAHVCYEIDIPISVDPFIERAPVRFAAAIECAYRESLKADEGYAGTLCKNPLHKDWITTVFRDEGYSLHEMSEYIPDLNRFNDKRRKIPEAGLGRNVALFNRLRLWAYKAVNIYRNGDYDTWHEAVAEKARSYNDFSAPLDWNEVKHTVKSVAKWVWRIAPESALRFSRLQAERGAKRHERFLDEHGAAAYEQAQAKAALARAAGAQDKTRERIIEAIGQLTASGQRVTIRAVARLLDMAPSGLSTRYKDLFKGDRSLSQP